MASSKVPSLWMTGCWILTSMPWSSRLDLHMTQSVVRKHSSHNNNNAAVRPRGFSAGPSPADLEPSVSVSEMKVGVAMSGLFRSLRM
ncbi:hypothetical protein EYF80_045696 [Liparis tanakae]|uniref:Uncharacterized protein n=1 Tax=Liparis tanakae TaxID=230148 RepID=A0A4Z2FSH6_9TELE|nr:hypothetical protein EYF80_045696 [Liparis tanakae]